MLISTVNFVSNHSTYSKCVAKPVEDYMVDENLNNNIRARVAFLAMGLLATAEAIVALAASVLGLGVCLVTFFQVPDVKVITYELFRIGSFNVITTVASAVGSLGHPKGGVWMIQECCRSCHEFFKG